MQSAGLPREWRRRLRLKHSGCIDNTKEGATVTDAEIRDRLKTALVGSMGGGAARRAADILAPVVVELIAEAQLERMEDEDA